MIPKDGAIRCLVIDLASLLLNFRYWESLSSSCVCVFMERYEKDGEILFWESEERKAVTIPYPDTKEELASAVMKCTAQLTGCDGRNVCVLSADGGLIKACLSFRCMAFSVCGSPSFSDVHELPDYLVSDEAGMYDALMLGRILYPGEAASLDLASSGVPIRTALVSYGMHLPLYVCGRYFGKEHFLSRMDRYTKDLRDLMSGRPMDEKYVRMMTDTVLLIQKERQIDAVVCVPPKPGEASRFGTLLSRIEEHCGIEDKSDALYCFRNYPALLPLSKKERQEAVFEAFRIKKGYDLHRHFLVVDDVVSSGATFEEMAQTLFLAGAEDVAFLAMAAAQFPLKSSRSC